MSKTNNSSAGGIGILGLLGIVFVTLKLTGVIAWSWWWVTLPFWGGFALIGSVLVIIGIAILVSNFLLGKTD